MIAAKRSNRVAIAMPLLLAACNNPVPRDHTTSAPTATPSPVQTAPAPAPTHIVDGSLGAFVGHYPFDKVDGQTFFEAKAVADAVDTLVPDAATRTLILNGDGPTTPIVRHGGRLRAWGCEVHNCGDHNWTIELAPDGSDPAICLHDAATMQDRSRWMRAAGGAEMRAGGCPSD